MNDLEVEVDVGESFNGFFGFIEIEDNFFGPADAIVQILNNFEKGDDRVDQFFPLLLCLMHITSASGICIQFFTILFSLLFTDWVGDRQYFQHLSVLSRAFNVKPFLPPQRKI